MKHRLLVLALALLLPCVAVFAGGADEGSDATVDGDVIWSGEISVAPYMFGPIEEDVITPVIEERLLGYGYDVDLIHDYIETSQYHEILNLRIASGDAPDIFYPGNIARLYAWYEQGAIAEWDEEFFREHAPNVVNFWENTQIIDDRYRSLFWDMGRIDGMQVAVPAVTQDFGPSVNAFYNKQWLDNLGVDELPLTLNDWYDLMIRFTEEDPDGNGQDDTYGFSASGTNIVFGAFGAFTGFGGFDTGHFYLRDGQMVSTDLWPGNKDALAFLNKAYEDGVLDPEFVTGENTGGYWAISHSFVNGKIGYSYTSNIYHWWKPEDNNGTAGRLRQEFEAVQGPGADIVFGPYPRGPEGWWGGFTRTPVTMVQGITYDADLNDDPDKLAAIFGIMDVFALDYNLSVFAEEGIEGEHFDYATNETGGRYILDRLLPNEKNALGIMAMRDLFGPQDPVNLQLNEESANEPQSKIRLEIVGGEQMGGGYVTDIYVALPSESLYRSELTDYRNSTWIQMITGELPIDYWDTYVEQYNSIGGAILTQEANEWYQNQ